MVYRSEFGENWDEANPTSTSETGCALLTTTKAEIAILLHDRCAREKNIREKNKFHLFPRGAKMTVSCTFFLRFVVSR